jgi:hypothetical protein
MITLSSTLVLYLLVGIGVALAVFLTLGSAPGRRWNALLALLFWPLYLPLLLTRAGGSASGSPRRSPPPSDEMTAAIVQVDRELAAALASLDGWADGVRESATERIRSLRGSWFAQAERIREMDRLLKVTERPDPEAAEQSQGQAEHLEGRLQNLAKLREVRRRSYDDLMGTLAWIRELISMIHLAKFTGAPPARAEELVAQILNQKPEVRGQKSENAETGIKLWRSAK